MSIDFEQEYGVNAGYVLALFESWREEPDGLGPAQSKLLAEKSLSVAVDLSYANDPVPVIAVEEVQTSVCAWAVDDASSTEEIRNDRGSLSLMAILLGM
jgi:hypothetical protein